MPVTCIERGMKRLLSITALAALVAGCAPLTWSKPGSSEAEFNRDHYACIQQASAAYPSAPTQIQTSAGYQSAPSSQINCQSFGYQTNCTSTAAPAYNVAPAYVTIDANQGNRNSTVIACLKASGYTPSR